jgi:plastocyanin
MNTLCAEAGVRLARAVFIGFAAAVMAGCGGDNPTAAEPTNAKRSNMVAATALNKASSAGRLLTSPEVSPIQEDPEDLSAVNGERAVYFAAVVDIVPGDVVEWISTGGASSTAVCTNSRQDGNLRFCRVSNATLAQNGTQIAIQVSRPDQGVAFQSRFATLTVTPAPVAPTITLDPVNQTVPAGQTALFEVAASGTNLGRFSSSRSGYIRYQWLKDGVAIDGATQRKLLLPTAASEAGSTFAVTVRASNGAGFALSEPVDFVVAPSSTFVNGDGGNVPGPQGSSLKVPANALAGAVSVSIREEAIPAGALPPGYIAVGNVTVVEPAGLIFAVPAELQLNAPAVIPAGMSVALIELNDTVAASAPNLNKRSTPGATRNSDQAVPVVCVNPQNINTVGRYGSALQRAARVLTSLVPSTACDSTEPLKIVLPPPDTQEPCAKDEDFALVSSVNNDDKTLVGRHVDCRRSVQIGVNLDVDLKFNPATGKYSLIPDPTAVQPGDIIQTFTYGTATVESRMSVYGPSRGLSKQVSLDVTVKDFRLNPGYPSILIAPGFVSVKIQPEVLCIAYEASVDPKCNVTAPPITAVFGVPAFVSFNVPFSWKKRPADPAVLGDRPFDVETFRVGFNRFNYTLYGDKFEIPRAGGAKRFMSSNLGESAKIRCDRGFPKMNGSDGCVFTDAAPVYDMTNRNAPETLGHVREAIRGLNEFYPIFAPGKFVLKPGSRAIAGDSEGLERTTDDATRDLNRFAAYEAADSIYKTRLPLNKTLRCQISVSGCEHDEFPFASTFNGAAFARDRTSVKLVEGTDNQRGGTPIGNFYVRERVLDFNSYPLVTPRVDGTLFWVFIDETESNTASWTR